MRKIEDIASELADALLATSDEKYARSWPLEHNGKQTGETVEVVVIRRRQNVRKSVILSESTTIQFFQSGRVCTACGGSGRV